MHILVLGVLVLIIQLEWIQAKPTADIAEEDSTLTAEIHVNYSRPPDFTLDPPNYRVASSINLTCVVHGSVGHVSYNWSSTCSEDRCFVQRKHTESVSTLILRPLDAGNHTCTATDFVGRDCNRTASASVIMRIVGTGIFDERAKTALPENGIIVTSQHAHTVHFYCWFSAVDNDTVVQFIDVSGTDVANSESPFNITTTAYGDSAVMEIAAISLSLSEQGVYTCRLNEEADMNVGIFRNEFHTAPVVTNLRQDTSKGVFALECISTGSPPTNVIWTKDGVEMTIDGTVHKLTQSITDRATSTYKNVLKIEDSINRLPGEYSCKVSNSFGTSNTVNISGRVMHITGNEEVLIAGLTVHIFCTTNQKGHAKIQWLLGGFEVPLETSTTQEVVLPLELESTGLDGAMFTCRITGSDNAVYDETITLKVKEFENIITIEAPEMPLTAGNTYSISCIVRADVQGTVEWVDSTGSPVKGGSDLSIDDPVTSGNKTTLTLHFDPLHTSHGDQYTCISTVDILQSVQRVSEDVMVQIPKPTISVSQIPATTPIYTTSMLILTCDIEVDKAVDTPVEINSTWTGPEGVLSSDNSTTTVAPFETLRRTRIVVTLESLESSDSGAYLCEASINPTSTSAYIITSNETSSRSLNIMISLNVSITVSYTPPAGESIQPHHYRAGTPVTLYCRVAGASGHVTYEWTSTCSGCFVSGTSSSVSRNFLRSTDAGLHTCTVRDSIGNEGSTTIPVNITGAGVYVLVGTHIGAISNNSLVIARDSAQSLNLYCVSNSTSSNVGSVIGKSGYDITSTSSDAFVINRYNPGGLHIVSPYSYTHSYTCGGYWSRTCYETRYERVSLLNQGIYTCQLPDAGGSLLTINFGIYMYSFNAPPRITNLRHVTSSDVFTIECTSTDSPATVVTWVKDGTNLTVDGNRYHTTQRVTSRSHSTYLNILHINDVPADLVGMYTCHVSNILGKSSREVSVNGIQISGYEETFEVGSTAAVTCSSDLDVLNIEWLLDDDNTSTSLMISYTSVNKLTFRSVSASIDDAQYTCRVTSPYGVQSKTVIFHVEIPIAWASVETAPIIDATDGEEYYLTCTVTVINGLTVDAVSVTWLGPDGKIVNEDNITSAVVQATSSTSLFSRLTFRPLRSTHGGDYTCKATVKIPGLKEPPPRTALAQLVVTSVAAFQLKFGPVEYCIRWTVDKALHMEQATKAALTSGIRDRCDCNFSVDAINDGEFSCQSTVTEVVYRSKINGTSDTFTAPELLAFVEDWIANDGTFTVDVFRLRTNTECPLHIQSFHQPECAANGTIPSISAGCYFGNCCTNV